MVQVKKEAVRSRILATANQLFEKNGYIATTMSQIAKQAHVASATIYIYFPSKFDVALAIFEPWLVERLNETEIRAKRIRSHRQRLEYVLKRLWVDIPLEQNNYMNSLMQALAISRDDYKPTIFLRLRDQVHKLISDCLPPERKDAFDVTAFSYLAVMAFDGFVINGKLNPTAVSDNRIITTTCDLILGKGEKDPQGDPAEAARPASRKRMPA